MCFEIQGFSYFRKVPGCVFHALPYRPTTQLPRDAWVLSPLPITPVTSCPFATKYGPDLFKKLFTFSELFRVINSGKGTAYNLHISTFPVWKYGSWGHALSLSKYRTDYSKKRTCKYLSLEPYPYAFPVTVPTKAMSTSEGDNEHFPSQED